LFIIQVFLKGCFGVFRSVDLIPCGDFVMPQKI
jgi:hypothetical protein